MPFALFVLLIVHLFNYSLPLLGYGTGDWVRSKEGEVRLLDDLLGNRFYRGDIKRGPGEVPLPTCPGPSGSVPRSPGHFRLRLEHLLQNGTLPSIPEPRWPPQFPVRLYRPPPYPPARPPLKQFLPPAPLPP